MDFDEDQQALAWQWIIRNKAFDNVRVQRGESWVDAACRTLDELIDQKEQAEKSLDQLEFKATPKVVWRERALEAERYLMEARRELDEEKSRSQFFAKRADRANGDRDAARENAEHYQDMCEAMKRERDEWKSRAKNLEAEVTELQDQLEFKARIERVTKSDMTFEEVKRAIESVRVLDQSKFAQFAAEAVMRIMADPPALVIRESQIDNVEVTSIDDGRFWLGDDALVNACAYPTAEEVRESVEDLLASAAEAEAVARAIDNGVSSQDKRVAALAEIIGDFAIADEHSGERNDEQLARLLISRGVTVDE